MTPKFTLTTAVLVQNSLWEEKIHSLKTTSTQFLNILFGYHLFTPEQCEQKIKQYINCLKKWQKELTEDKNKFLNVVFPLSSNNTFVAIVSRCTHRIATLITNRQLSVLEQIVANKPNNQPFSENDEIQFSKIMCQPSKTIHHSLVTSLADLPHYIINLAFEQNLQRLVPSDIIHEVNDAVLYSKCKKIDEMLLYITELSSYPVITPELKGSLLPTLFLEKQGMVLNFTDMGLDNRSRIVNITSPRCCVLCRLENLRAGYVDRHEQRKRSSCYCVYRPVIQSSHSNTCIDTTYLDALYTTAGTMKTRWLSLINPSCDCEEHTLLSQHVFFSFDKLLRYIFCLPDSI